MGWKEDLNYGLGAFGLRIPDESPVDDWGAALAQDPLRSSAAVVGISSVLFFLAERGHNPRVNDLWDAMVYTSTCLSVGYSNIFPQTPVGKIIGSTLMTYGPSLTAKTMDAPGNARRDAVQVETLETLKQILAKLEPPATPTAAPTDPATGDSSQ